jgi:hypothetical protein
MAIFKTGDSMPILSTYGTDGEEEICPTCGSKLTTVAMSDNNKLVCECSFDEESDT